MSEQEEIATLKKQLAEIDEAISSVTNNGQKFNTGATTGTGAGVTLASLKELRDLRGHVMNRLRFLDSLGVW